jgi:Tfp pilus assembly protein PilN
VAATDREKMANLLKTFRLARIEPSSVELSVIGSIRAIFAEKISNKYDVNVLTAFLQGSVLTVCVFRKEALDFIRSIDLGRDVEDIDKCIVRCEDEISAVIQYYDVEVDDAADNSWELIVLFDNPEVDNRHIEESMSRSFKCELHVCSASTVYSDTPLEINDSINSASVTAVGLAMKSLDVQQPGLDIQLMPSEAKDVRATKKFLLVTANIAAASILIIFLVGAFVRVQLGRTQSALADSKLDPSTNIEMLLDKQKSINSQIALLSEKSAKINEIFEDQPNIQWDQIMREIQQKIPQAICLNRLTSSDDVNLILKGNATSFRAIHVFNRLLTQSKFFASATVTKTNKDNNEGLINFSILAVLENKRITQTDAD